MLVFTVLHKTIPYTGQELRSGWVSATVGFADEVGPGSPGC